MLARYTAKRMMEHEAWVMADIGLGTHFTWYDGSRCAWRRRHAVDNLASVIQSHHDAYIVTDALLRLVGGSARRWAISPPIGVLIALARETAQYLDMSAYSLKNTWQVCADIIEAHIAAGTNENTPYIEACVDYWSPLIATASSRLDRMGYQADHYLASKTEGKFKL